MHPTLVEALNTQHRLDLLRTAGPRRATRPLRRPLATAPVPTRRRATAARSATTC